MAENIFFFHGHIAKCFVASFRNKYRIVPKTLSSRFLFNQPPFTNSFKLIFFPFQDQGNYRSELSITIGNSIHIFKEKGNVFLKITFITRITRTSYTRSPLQSSHFEITFPKRFTWQLKLLRLLPYRLYFALTRRAGG